RRWSAKEEATRNRLQAEAAGKAALAGVAVGAAILLLMTIIDGLPDADSGGTGNSGRRASSGSVGDYGQRSRRDNQLCDGGDSLACGRVNRSNPRPDDQ